MNAVVDIAGGGDRPFQPLPHNLETEQALLGAILVNNAAYDRVAGFLRAQHFYEAVHGAIYDAVAQLVDQGKVADPFTLTPFFEKDERLEEVGQAQYLARLAVSAATVINAADYGRTIMELAQRREIITIGNRMVLDAYDAAPGLDPTDIVDDAETSLLAVARDGGVAQRECGVSEALDAALATHDAAAARGDGLVGIPTGLTRLDTLMGGLQDERLIILGARPSMGKTALGTIEFCLAAARLGYCPGLFSLEMNRVQVGARMLSNELHRLGQPTPYTHILKGQVGALESHTVQKARAALQELPIRLSDKRGLSIGAIRAQCRQWARDFRQQGRSLDLIVIDHLLHIKPPGGRSRVEQAGAISRELLALPGDLGIPVVALCQLSRETERREDKRPTLSDLRWAGELEQDADTVIFLYRDEYYLQRQKKPGPGNVAAQEDFDAAWLEAANKAELIVAKNRDGPVETVTVGCEIKCSRFYDLGGGHG